MDEFNIMELLCDFRFLEVIKVTRFFFSDDLIGETSFSCFMGTDECLTDFSGR